LTIDSWVDRRLGLIENLGRHTAAPLRLHRGMPAADVLSHRRPSTLFAERAVSQTGKLEP
jgi:hypothetical protein